MGAAPRCQLPEAQQACSGKTLDAIALMYPSVESQDATAQREDAGVQLYGFQQQLSTVQTWLSASKAQVWCVPRILIA